MANDNWQIEWNCQIKTWLELAEKTKPTNTWASRRLTPSNKWRWKKKIKKRISQEKKVGLFVMFHLFPYFTPKFSYFLISPRAFSTYFSRFLFRSFAMFWFVCIPWLFLSIFKFLFLEHVLIYVIKLHCETRLLFVCACVCVVVCVCISFRLFIPTYHRMFYLPRIIPLAVALFFTGLSS